MLGITRKHIQPILNLMERFPSPSPININKIGAWGIVFLCCGAMAAKNPSWIKKLVNRQKDLGPSEFSKIQHGGDNRANEDYVIKFSEYIAQWCNDDHAAMVAQEWMKKYRARFNSSFLEHHATYIQLAYCVNSFQHLQMEELFNCSGKNRPDFGWPELFFAAGFVLSNEEKVKWQQMASSIYGLSGSRKKKVAALFRHYTGEDQFWKLGNNGVKADQIKKGMRVRTVKRMGISCVNKGDTLQNEASGGLH